MNRRHEVPGGDAVHRRRRRRFLLITFVVLAFVQIRGTAIVAAHASAERRPLDLLGYVLVSTGPALVLLLGPVPLARRQVPAVVVAGASLTTGLYLGLSYPHGPAPLAFAIAQVFAIMTRHRLAAWVSAGGAFAVFGGGQVLTDGPQADAWTIAAHGAWLLVLLAAVEGFRVRRERIADAARTHAEERRRQAGEERLRIAQELHDVLAHNISLINIQAGVGLHLMDDRPEQARTALTAIKEASAETLNELKSVLDLLRADGAAPREPTAGLADLAGLVDRAAGAGLIVRTDIRGEVRTVPKPVDLAAFRIVQESLTNVVRHTAARSADVRLTYAVDGLGIEVVDPGGGHLTGPLVAHGNGLIGMRERALALGGTFEAGLVAGGGFRVHAVLPTTSVLPSAKGSP